MRFAGQRLASAGGSLSARRSGRLHKPSCPPFAEASRGGSTVDSPRFNDAFYVRDLKIELAAHPAPVPPLGPSVPFGKIFTQHFFVVDWDSQCGWGAPRIEPVRPFALHPAAQTLQYGSHCFEGMKAYRSRTTGRPSLFRPHLNMERFHRSAERLYLPQFDPAELLACIQKLVAVEHAWVPTEPDCSLYLRPTLMATTPYLGVGPADDCSLFVLASPCGPFLPPNDTAPVRFFLEENVVRAAAGGVGEFKVGGNYAPTIRPQMAARNAHGCTQVLYTIATASGARFISEAGAMNVFFVFQRDGGAKPELVTPPLDGTILPGVTRQSVLDLARSWGDCDVSERPVTVDELIAAARAGNFLEAFASGTAAVILPVEAFVRDSGEEIATTWGSKFRAGGTSAPVQRGGPVALRMATTLRQIQFGEVQHEWNVPVM